MTAHIRLAREADADLIAAMYAPIVETTAISFETVPPDAREVARRISETLRSYPWLVCDDDGRIAGYAYATKHRVRDAYQWSVDASVYVADAHRRTGVGRRLYTSLFGILAAQGYFNAFAGIALPNPASVALHESMGFQKIGVYRQVGYKLGAWHDVGWWQLALREREASPRPPMDMAAVRRRADWDALLALGRPTS